MRNSGSVGLFATLALIMTSAPGEARADLTTIIGNLSGYNAQNRVSVNDGHPYAVEFSVSADQTVSTAQLEIENNSGATVIATLGIYAVASGKPSSLIGSFTNVSLTDGTNGLETFSGNVALTGSSSSPTSYFLALGVSPGNRSIDWDVSNGKGITPTSPSATATYIAIGSEPGPYKSGNYIPNFELDSGPSFNPFSVSAPEPSTLVTAGTGGLFTLAVWCRRRRRDKATA